MISARPRFAWKLLATVAVVLALSLAASRTARADDPSDRTLVLLGLGLAIPDYFLGVTMHEGSHALVAKAYGAEIVEFDVLPGMHDGSFYFGLTRWNGHLSDNEYALALLAPKITDFVMLTGYSLLVALDGLPDGKYGQLVLFVLATGSWVDFAKDVPSWRPTNDLVKIHALYGRRTWVRRLPYQLFHAGLCAVSGYFLWEGYQHLFADAAMPAGAPVILQLFGTTF